MRFRWLLGALVATSLMAGLHFWALADFLYWKYRWFDMPMHLIGGVVLGSFAIALSGEKFRPFMYLGFVALAAFLWELFEWYFGIAVPAGVDYRWDTAHDVLNDAIGATAVYVLARYTIWRSVPSV